MPNLVRTVGFGLLSLLLPSLMLATPARFLWKSEFSDKSSLPLRELHESLYASKAAELEARSVSGLVWKEEDLELKIHSGIIFLEPPIEGVTAGAGSVPTFVEKEKWRNLLLTKQIAYQGEGGLRHAGDYHEGRSGCPVQA